MWGLSHGTCEPWKTHQISACALLFNISLKSMTVESWVMMKRCLFWTNEAFSCSAISKIHCENVTQFICTIYANAHPDSCVKCERKVKPNIKMLQKSHLLAWILHTDHMQMFRSTLYIRAGVIWQKGLHYIHEHAR